MGNIIWINKTETFLIQALVEQVRNGGRGENGFDKSVWTTIASQLNAKFSDILIKPITDIQARSKKSELRKEFEIVQAIRQSPGFRWDSKKGIPIATDEVWNSYLKVHKEAAKYRTKALPRYNDLAELFTESQATGPSSVARGLQDSSSQLEESSATPTERRIIKRGQKRSRSDATGRNDHSLPESSIRSGKRVEVSQAKLTAVLRDTVNEAILNRTQGPVSKHELAIRVLQSQYEGKLSDDELVKAAMVLENYNKACIFIGFTAGLLRDHWLRREIERSNFF